MRFDDREVLMVEVYNDVAVRRCPLTLSESLANALGGVRSTGDRGIVHRASAARNHVERLDDIQLFWFIRLRV